MEQDLSVGEVERAVVLLLGMPLGTLWLRDGDLVISTLEPSATYEAFTLALLYLSEPYWALGFLQGNHVRMPAEALAPRADLPFELQDVSGRTLAVDFVNVIESPRRGEPPVVVVCRKHVHAAVASVLRGQRGEDRADVGTGVENPDSQGPLSPGKPLRDGLDGQKT